MGHIKGLDLCERYYLKYGASMIQDRFPDYSERIAVGLVGRGSECYGFDDFISRDHDFGPSFCLWLTDEDYGKIGENLIVSYRELPEFFMGYKRPNLTNGEDRVGVLKISDFYRKYTGKKDADLTLSEWMRIPEHFLAEVTNGKVFRDDLGEFSKIRSNLLKYYPEDIRIKKIAKMAALMAQSGQYNYSRSMRRSEAVAARLAIGEFIMSTISIVYLLNKEYQPYYKWAYRGMESFKILPTSRKMIEGLALLGLQGDAWNQKDDFEWMYKLNTNDKAVNIIENLCSMIIDELNIQNLTDHKDSFLLNHTESIMFRIKDDNIRALHVMA